MTVPAYDIFKKQDAGLIWVETAEDLESAKNRVKELSRGEKRAEFVVFNQHTQQVVVNFQDTV
jgi:hypothetical protein